MKKRTLLASLEGQMAVLNGLISKIEAEAGPLGRSRRRDAEMMDLEYRLRKLRSRNYFL